MLWLLNYLPFWHRSSVLAYVGSPVSHPTRGTRSCRPATGWVPSRLPVRRRWRSGFCWRGRPFRRPRRFQRPLIGAAWAEVITLRRSRTKAPVALVWPSVPSRCWSPWFASQHGSRAWQSICLRRKCSSATGRATVRVPVRVEVGGPIKRSRECSRAWSTLPVSLTPTRTSRAISASAGKRVSPALHRQKRFRR